MHDQTLENNGREDERTFFMPDGKVGKFKLTSQIPTIIGSFCGFFCNRDCFGIELCDGWNRD